MHKKCTFSAHFVHKISMFVHFKMYKCTKIRDYFRENVFPFFPIFLNIFLIFLKNIFGKIRENWKNMGKLGKCWEKIVKKWENVFPKIVSDKNCIRYISISWHHKSQIHYIKYIFIFIRKGCNYIWLTFGLAPFANGNDDLWFYQSNFISTANILLWSFDLVLLLLLPLPS